MTLANLRHDLSRGFRPHEWLGVSIVIGHVGRDGADEFVDAAESAAPDAFGGNLREKALNSIDPGRRSRREVLMVARMLREPCFDRWMLVRSIVVHDDVDIQLARDVAVDVFEELEELRMPMAWQTPLENCTAQRVKRCKQR